MLAWWGGQWSKSSARTSHHRCQSSPWSTHKTIVLAISDQTPDMELCCWIVFRVRLSLPIANMWGILFQLTGGGWWVCACQTGPAWLPVGQWELGQAGHRRHRSAPASLPSISHQSRPTDPVCTSLVELFVYFCYKW